jgi:hypothetical protein
VNYHKAQDTWKRCKAQAGACRISKHAEGKLGIAVDGGGIIVEHRKEGETLTEISSIEGNLTFTATALKSGNKRVYTANGILLNRKQKELLAQGKVIEALGYDFYERSSEALMAATDYMFKDLQDQITKAITSNRKSLIPPLLPHQLVSMRQSILSSPVANIDTSSIANIELPDMNEISNLVYANVSRIFSGLYKATKELGERPEFKFFQALRITDSEIDFDALDRLTETGWVLSPATYDFYGEGAIKSNNSVIDTLSQIDSPLWSPKEYPHLREANIKGLASLFQDGYYTDCYSKATALLDFTARETIRDDKPIDSPVATSTINRISKTFAKEPKTDEIIYLVKMLWKRLYFEAVKTVYVSSTPDNPIFGRHAVHHGYATREASKEETLKVVNLLLGLSSANNLLTRHEAYLEWLGKVEKANKISEETGDSSALDNLLMLGV